MGSDASDAGTLSGCLEATAPTLSFVQLEGVVSPCAVAITADEQTIYVAGCASDSLAVYHRELKTGVISHVQTLRDGQGGVENLAYPEEIWLTPDDSQLLVGTSDGLVLLEADTATGHLSPGAPLPLDCTQEGTFCSIGHAISGNSVGDIVAARTAKTLHLLSRNTKEGSFELLTTLSDESLSEIAVYSFVLVEGSLLSTAGDELFVLGYDDLPGHTAIIRLSLMPADGELTFLSRFERADAAEPDKWNVGHIRLSSDGQVLYGFGYLDNHGFISGLASAPNGTDLELISQTTVSEALDGETVAMHDLQVSADGGSIWVAFNRFFILRPDLPQVGTILRYSASAAVLDSNQPPTLLANNEWDARGESFGHPEEGGQLGIAPSGTWLAVTLDESNSLAVFGCLDKLAP